MQTIRNRTISNECLAIDGKSFIDCAIVDCILEYRGGAFTLERTRISGCRYLFFGPARGTVHFLQVVGLLPEEPGDWGELPESVH